MQIEIGYTIEKPVETQEQCDAYAATARAVNAHNAACSVGDTLWTITDSESCYTVEDGGVVPEAETPKPTAEEQIAALQEQNEMLKQCLLEMSEVVYA